MTNEIPKILPPKLPRWNFLYYNTDYDLLNHLWHLNLLFSFWAFLALVFVFMLYYQSKQNSFELFVVCSKTTKYNSLIKINLSRVFTFKNFEKSSVMVLSYILDNFTNSLWSRLLMCLKTKIETGKRDNRRVTILFN